ncbi:MULTISPECIES: hypothetical protein [unclassified Sinorhizobium]|uniref:hypothetical protein n=1 Tax=unclassified Sinorhizobium TaxID=2613772 RepID=UPI0035258C5E
MAIDTSQTIDFTPAMRGTMQTTTDADGIRATTAEAVAGTDDIKYMTAFKVREAVTAFNTLPATNVTVTPSGGISATNAQAALEQLDTLKAPKAAPTFTGTATFQGPVNLSSTFSVQTTSLFIGGVTFSDTATFNGAVTFTNPQTFSNVRINPRITTVVSSSSIVPNVDTTDIYAVSALAINITVQAPAGTPVDGQQLKLRIRDNGTARTITWNAIYSPISSELWASTIPNKSMIWVFVWNASTSKWEVQSSNPMPGTWG